MKSMMMGAALCCILAAGQAADLPPPADLEYGVKALQDGVTLTGESRLEWRHAPGSYTARMETRAMLFGKILEEKSEGGVDARGLAPVRYTEQRFRKSPSAASFDRAAQTISFQQSDQRYPIKGGEQDRASVVWQLIATARAAPAKFGSGASYSFFVVGQRDGEPWTFRVGRQEKVRGPNGDTLAWHVTRNPPPDSKQQQLDIWLAPALQWYPVRLRFTEGGGDYIEQTLREVQAK